MRTFYIYLSVAGWVWTLGFGIFLYLRLKRPNDPQQGFDVVAKEPAGIENRHE